ncbi:MAG: SDR family oxidoreductase [Hyphomonadaceae bacterium]|nr:SDR family oxidoreductase [Hyphomonadaceae bacterium]
MQDFSGKLAVITGGGAGIGRALTKQLASEGCSVAMCDVSQADMDESCAYALDGAPQGVRVTSFLADVAMEAELEAFRDDTLKRHEIDHIHLLFNNAGIGGGGSMISSPRDVWERTFGVCWYGVYYSARAFLPALMRADEGHMINVSSVNGFWASLGPETSHTAYSAAKFAVKGFTEALVNDFRNNAPHLKASVVMPGHIGTNIALNTMREFGELSSQDIPSGDPDFVGDQQARGEAFRDTGLNPVEAAKIILQGVRDERWRILVGTDAQALDQAVREAPEEAYEQEFMETRVAPVLPSLLAALD